MTRTLSNKKMISLSSYLILTITRILNLAGCLLIQLFRAVYLYTVYLD